MARALSGLVMTLFDNRIAPVILIGNKMMLALCWVILFFYSAKQLDIDARADFVSAQAGAYFLGTFLTFGLGLHASRYPHLQFAKFFVTKFLLLPILLLLTVMLVLFISELKFFNNLALLSLVWGAVLSFKVNLFDYFVSRRDYWSALSSNNFIEVFLAAIIFLSVTDTLGVYQALWIFPAVLFLSPAVIAVKSIRKCDDVVVFTATDFLVQALPSAFYRVLSTRKKEFSVMIVGAAAAGSEFIWLFGLGAQLLAAMNLPFVAMQSWIIGSLAQKRDAEVYRLWRMLLVAQFIFVASLTVFIQEFLVLFSSANVSELSHLLLALVWSRFASLLLGPIIERSLYLNRTSYLIWLGVFELLAISITAVVADADYFERTFVYVFCTLFWVAPVYALVTKVNESDTKELK